MAWYHKFPWTNFHELNLDWIMDIVGKAEKVLPDAAAATEAANEAAQLANNNAVAASDAATRANIAARNIDPITATAATVYGAGASVTVEKTNPGTALHFLIPAGERGIPGPAGGASNLITNGNFSHPVNQRGHGSYNGTGTKIYTIDRWFTESNASPAVTVKSGYITVANGAEIKQIIPAIDENYFPSDIDVGFTAVAREINGTVHIASHSISDSKLSFVIGDGNSGITVTLGSGNWEYCALYKGVFTADTVPGYIPKLFSSEMLECKRFYNVVKTLIGAPLGTPKRLLINLPIPMYIKPTVSYTVVSGENPSVVVMQNEYTVDCTAYGDTFSELLIMMSAEP